MKKILLFFSLIIFTLVYMSCSQDSGITDSDAMSVRDTVGVGVMRIKGVKSEKNPLPLYIVESKGTMLSEIYVPGVSDSMLIITCMGKSYADDATVLVTPKNIIFMSGSPVASYGFPSQVLVASSSDDFSSLTEGTLNWYKGTFSPSQTISVGISSATRARKDDMDDVRALMYDMLEKLSSAISDMGTAMGALKYGGPASAVCSVITGLAIPTAKLQLYDDDPQKQNEIKMDYAIGIYESYAISEFFEQDFDKMLATFAYKYSYRGGIWAGNKAIEYYEQIKNADYSSYTSTGSRMMSRAGANTQNVDNGVKVSTLKEASEIELQVSVSDVEENSMVLTGSVNYNYAYGQLNNTCWGTGYYYSEQGGVTGTVDSKLEGGGIASKKITGMKPATKYLVQAFYKGTSQKYTSLAKEVITKGFLFEMDKNAVTFGQLGGKEIIHLTLGAETTFKVTSCPKWVNATCDVKGKRIIVEAEEVSTKSRTGEIVVEVTNFYGDKQTYIIAVSQTTSIWNGTSWDCTVNHTTNISVSAAGVNQNINAGNGQFNFTIDIVSVEEGKYTLGGDLSAQEGLTSSLKVDENDHLLLDFTMNMTVNVQGTSSKCKMSGSIVLGRDNNLYVSGTYKATGSSNSYSYGIASTATISQNGTVSGYATSGQ